MTAVLRGILAQRLVRRLCHRLPSSRSRRRSRAGDPAAARPRSRRRRPTLWHAVGCPKCRNTGYRGRLAIAEFLRADAGDRAPDLRPRRTVRDSNAPPSPAGMVTMFEAGIEADAGRPDHDRGSSPARIRARRLMASFPLCRPRSRPGGKLRGVDGSGQRGRSGLAAAAPGQHSAPRRTRRLGAWRRLYWTARSAAAA